MKKILYGVAAGLALVTALACSGTGPTATGDGSRPTASPAASSARSLPPLPSPPAASPKPTVPTFEDGSWIVAVDFPAGTYRTTEVVSSCYWSITKEGSNGSDIIENDIVTGGKPTVTLKKGQEFKSARCGTWVKIK